MAARIEVTKQLKGAYQKAQKAEKSGILDNFCQSTGLGRSSARRYLSSVTLGEKDVLRLARRRNRPSKYSPVAKEKLIWLWRIMFTPCGKYLVAALPQWISSLEAHGELVLNQKGWSEEVRKELLSMKTFIPDVQDVNREWLLVDAAQKPLGRLAVQIADLLRGRNKPTFTPHVDTGAFVVVINARQVALSGKKEETKTYRSFSGYRNGLKITPAARVRERHPERMVESIDTIIPIGFEVENNPRFVLFGAADAETLHEGIIDVFCSRQAGRRNGPFHVHVKARGTTPGNRRQSVVGKLDGPTDIKYQPGKIAVAEMADGIDAHRTGDLPLGQVRRRGGRGGLPDGRRRHRGNPQPLQTFARQVYLIPLAMAAGHLQVAVDGPLLVVEDLLVNFRRHHQGVISQIVTGIGLLQAVEILAGPSGILGILGIAIKPLAGPASHEKRRRRLFMIGELLGKLLKKGNNPLPIVPPGPFLWGSQQTGVIVLKELEATVEIISPGKGNRQAPAENNKGEAVKSHGHAILFN